MNLVCTASGLPVPTITWQKPLGHLPRGKTTVIDGNMTILRVAKEDRETYVCSVKNLLGEDSALAQVTVERLRSGTNTDTNTNIFHSRSRFRRA